MTKREELETSSSCFFPFGKAVIDGAADGLRLQRLTAEAGMAGGLRLWKNLP